MTLAGPLAVLLAACVAAAACAGPAARVGEPATPVTVPPPAAVATPGPSSPPPAPAAAPSTSSPAPAPVPPDAGAAGAARGFTGPDALGDALLAAEAAIRDPATSPDALRSSAWAQQQAYRDLVAHPEWRAPVRARLPTPLQGALDANVRAGEALRGLVKPRTQLPDWRIVAPPPVAELRGHYAAAQGEFGVDWTYLAAIHLIETRMGRIRGTSVAGARGPMQFLPSTWDAYGEGDIDDPRDAIRAAGRYLVAHGAPNNMRRALYAYNHSERYVDAVEAYASVMRADERAYLGYYHWQVYYRTVDGDVVLPEGYGS